MPLLTKDQEIERAYQERDGCCCSDCDPNHPSFVLADALDEIIAYKETL